MNSIIPGADESEELTPGSSANQPAETTTALNTAEPDESNPAASTSEGSSNGVPQPADESPASAPEETVSEAESAPVEASREESITMAEAMAQAPDTPQLKRGELIEGTVISTSPTSVLVDIGGKAEGIIPGRELERMNRETLEMLKPGEVIPVYVVSLHDHQGNVVLSVNRALEERDWQLAEQYRVEQKVYESRVAGYNKGGLIVRFGRVRGFVPQSQ